MTTESDKAFLEYDWGKDLKWQDYLKGLYPTPPASKILKFKKKYYQREIDAEFDINTSLGETSAPQTTSPSSNTTSSSSAPPTATRNADTTRTVGRSSLERVAIIHLIGALVFNVLSVLPTALASRAYTISIVAYLIGCMAMVCAHMGVPKFNMEWWSLAGQLDAFQMLMIVMGATSLKLFAALLSPALGAVQLIADSPTVNAFAITRKYTNLVKAKRNDLYRLRAHVEVTTAVLVLVLCVMGRLRLWPCVLYWQTLRGRASMNPYTRDSFKQVHDVVKRVLGHPMAPAPLLKGYEWIASKVAH